MFRPEAVDLPLFDCFVLIHIDGGDGMFGARQNLPVHLPLGAPRLGLQQVHPFLGFDPAEERTGPVSFNGGGDLCGRSEVGALRVPESSSSRCVMAKAIPQMDQ